MPGFGAARSRLVLGRTTGGGGGTTYNLSVSLNAAGSQSQVGPITMAVASPLSAVATQVAGMALSMQFSTALGLLGATATSGVLQVNPSLTLASATTLTASLQNTIALLASLASRADVTSTLVGNTYNLSLTLALQQELTEALQRSLNQSIGLASAVSVAPVPALIVNSTLAILVQAAQSVSGSATINASVLLSVLDGITSSLTGQVYTASTSLGVATGLTQSAAVTMAANLVLAFAGNIAEVAQATCNTAVSLGVVTEVTPTLLRQINAILTLQLAGQLLESATVAAGGGPELITFVALQLRAAALLDLGLDVAKLSGISIESPKMDDPTVH